MVNSVVARILRKHPEAVVRWIDGMDPPIDCGSHIAVTVMNSAGHVVIWLFPKERLGRLVYRLLETIMPGIIGKPLH